MIHKFIIQYCVPCQFEKQARSLARVLLDQFGLSDENIHLEPSNQVGTFEVFMDDKLIFSKLEKGRLPQADEIINIIMMH